MMNNIPFINMLTGTKSPPDTGFSRRSDSLAM